MLNSSLKIAVFYDWLNQWGGAERVLLNILEAYPHADLFTLVHDPARTKWLPPHHKITTSFIQRLPFSKNNPLIYTPLYPLSLEQFDFSGYDLVISTTSTVGHCLLTPPETKFVCYFHNINRYLYQTPAKFLLLKPLLTKYRTIDHIYAMRPDYLLTNSATVQSRILTQYGRPSLIINPGIDTKKFTPDNTPPQDYYLVVSRLVDHKRIDLAINACHKLHKKLIIVGTGRNFGKVKNMLAQINDPQLQLLGQVSDSRLIDLYRRCIALICPQEEDFGITPLEALACGRPIIAFGRGGLTETVIDGKTGILFKDQTVDSLSAAIIQLEQMDISPNDCCTRAQEFSIKSFMLHFNQQIDSLWQTQPLPHTIT